MLDGLAGNDILDGVGCDTLIGGAGNDTYLVDNAGDAVSENENNGVDQVRTSITYSLAANVENLTLSGGVAINGTGNALANVLIGNSAANTLDGDAGADILIGARATTPTSWTTRAMPCPRMKQRCRSGTGVDQLRSRGQPGEPYVDR